VPGSILEWVKIIDEPVFLTSGVRSPTDDEKLIVRRAALAVVFALRVRMPKGNAEILPAHSHGPLLASMIHDCGVTALGST
jgi:hypothetical protein